MSNLSELLPAGGAGKNVSFVASGALPNGQAVVLKSDGTVEAVVQTSVAESIPAGAQSTFNAAISSFIQVSFDPSTPGKFVVAYRGANSGATPEYGFVAAGTVSGTSISFGTPVVFSSAGTTQIVVAYDPDSAGKFVVAYDAGSVAKTIVGTVSGTSITVGSEYAATSTWGGYKGISFIPNTPHKFILSFMKGSAGDGTIVIGTVSGTSISYGSESEFHSGGTTWTAVDFNPNVVNTFVVAYNDPGNSDYGTCAVGTISGTSISYGSHYVFNTSGSTSIRINFDHAAGNKFVVTYEDAGNSAYGTAIVGTVSGTAISYGSEYVFNSGATKYPNLQFDPNTLGKFVIGYIDDANSAPVKVIVGSISGTALSYASPISIGSNGSNYVSVDFNKAQAGQFVVAYRNPDGGHNGAARLGQIASSPTNLTATNFIGMADAAIADTAAGSVTIKGGLAKSISNVAIDVPGTVPDGNAVYFSTGRGRYSNVQWDPSDSTKFVVAWTDGSTTPTYQGYAAVGSVSGNTITYGTPVQFDSLMVADMDTNSIAFDPNQSGRFVIFYSGGGGQGSRAIAGTRSGTNLSFGTSVQVFNNPAVQPSIEFDPNTSGQFLMNWGDGANNLRVGTLSGTTITLGTLVSISASYNQPNLVADPNNAGKYLIVYQDGADSDHGYVAVVTVTGTTPSMATPVKFLSAACVQPKIVYDSGVADAFVMVFVDGGNSSHARAIAGVVSGTSVSFGTAITFNSNANNQLTTIISADPNKTGSFIAVADVNTIGEATFLTRSGTNTITAGATHTLYNAAKLKGAIAFNPSASKSGQFVYVTEDRSASPYKSISVLGQGAYTTSVIVPGTDYYVQADGTISTTSTSPAVKLGKALSTTSINLEFNT